ncbi:MAG: hypothetical protein K2W82_09380 [Candidatus Obscuribacterales bacterium]|nr:hypothetical protein [Candidatus Obscuribacterales bacterium]
MAKKTIGKRNQKGAMLGFVVTSAFTMMLTGLAFIQLILNIGGGNEVKNAIDAGALNVGRDVLTVKTTAQDSIEQQFNDVADSDNSFSLTNINRVWAKALLARMNAAAMQSEGTQSGTSWSDADALYDAAQRISDRLANQVKNQNNLHGFFNKVAGQNSARMLGNNATVQAQAGANWKTSLMDRGEESNIIIHNQQLPGNFAANGNNMFKQMNNGELRLKGYSPINILGRNICFVPFRHNEAPHLVSNNTFAADTTQANALPEWNNPVPNAFGCGGQSTGQNANAHQGVSFVMTNPQKSFDLAMPHAFVRIKFEDNTAYWYANGIYHGSNSYSFHTDVQVRQYEAGVGTMTVTATLGNEYMPPTLKKAIYAMPNHNYNDVTAVLLQRIREIKHDFSQADLDSLLSTQPFIPGAQEYILFPDSEGNIKAAPAQMAAAQAPWIDLGNHADGTNKALSGESIWWAPNFVVVVLVGPGPKPAPSFTHETGDIRWKPGTGLGGCLGELNIERATDIYANGVCSVL